MLVLMHRNRARLPGDPGGDAVNRAIDLGVIGGGKLPRMKPVGDAANQQKDENRGKDDEGPLAAPATRRGRARLCRVRMMNWLIVWAVINLSRFDLVQNHLPAMNVLFT